MNIYSLQWKQVVFIEALSLLNEENISFLSLVLFVMENGINFNEKSKYFNEKISPQFVNNLSMKRMREENLPLSFFSSLERMDSAYSSLLGY